MAAAQQECHDLRVEMQAMVCQTQKEWGQLAALRDRYRQAMGRAYAASIVARYS
jgi:hypothetical protein